MTETTDAATREQRQLIDSLPQDFRWGVATAAYQIEGAVAEDGRTPSIWDTFCRVPSAIDNGDTGDVACDHYHRMPGDVALVKELGADTYRFSVAWPRVQPGGRGPVNEAGMAFYDRLVDEVLEKDLTPWLTLYHWDLPQELEDAGGWPERDTAYRFADYSMLVFDRLSDRVRHWTTLNEPWCSAMHGYVHGVMAPGRRDFGAGMRAVHHLLLGHGLATQRMRAAAADGTQFGITLNMSTSDAATDSAADREAARHADGLGVRIYLDPLVHGRYPPDVVEDLAVRGATLPIEDGDLPVISTPLDFLGVNYYFGQQYSGVDEQGRTTGEDGFPVQREIPFGEPTTAMGWEILPGKFTELLTRIGRDYPNLPLFVTENGSAFDDEPDESGYVADDGRTAYLASHLAAVAAARQRGADVRGYFAWSLLDNFEWAYGYAKRFGLIRVDYETQQRTVKQSGLFYRDTVRRVRGA
ncbi:GH1 family beta-glucosidase [Amycolatopsis sp. PS_44_ISF1]|uniref:GH1 family beta-glucosidase n=1 Tax=Amycolatopsis sp. PS_44_ISF1 TaxID=2974917 RepID=UPI0028E05779|nr:GH1 family beta-glucosidase [Amycolatopsis sp. PS_44_ISF1]MDT8911245.1 GH1 family beta-glucosidase [Amycolatopsis sp. PS_44_ISF1]